MAAPTVGITVSIDPGARLRPGVEYLYVQRSYARAVGRAGAFPILIPPDAEPRETAQRCGAIVITGGDWLPDSFTAVAPLPRDAEQAERVAWDRALIDAALAAAVPLLGVCYGMQLLNLHFGGCLAAKPPQVGGCGDHGGSGRIAHTPVSTVPGTRLAGWVGADCQVACSHHQVVDAVAPGFRVAASARDGVVEAIEWEGPEWLLGVAWHPELDATGARIYRGLVQAALAEERGA